MTSPPTDVLFLGSKQLGMRHLSALVGALGAAAVTAAVLDDSADPRSCLPDYLAFADRHGLAHHVVAGTRDVRDVLLQVRPRLCVVSGWYHLLPDDMLASVPLGFLGVHASALPAYRGFAPLVWALINGERSVGVSLFHITPGLDDGPLFRQLALEVGPDESIGTLLERVGDASAAALADVVPAVLRGRLEPTPQRSTGASYCGSRTPADGLLDFGLPARSVHDLVRAQSSPYPGSFTYLSSGRRLTVWRTSVAPQVVHGAPGQLILLGGEAPLVVCGDRRAVRLHEVQLDGDQLQEAVNVLRSHRERLGPCQQGDGGRASST